MEGGREGASGGATCMIVFGSVFANFLSDCLDQLEWHRRYCVLAKDERRLYFFNDTEVSSPTCTCIYSLNVFLYCDRIFRFIDGSYNSI